MKIKECFECYQICQNFLQMELTFSLSYKFTKLISALEQDSTFYFKEMSLIIREYGEKDDNGNVITTKDNAVKIMEDKIELVEEKLKNLNNIEVTPPQITFTLDELESLNIKPADLRALLPFIKED